MWILCGLIVVVNLQCFAAQGMLGAAEARITNVEECPSETPHRYRMDVSRRKINRTTDAFDANVTFQEWADESVAIYVNVAKWVDGGYKPSAYEMSDSYACQFLMRHYPDTFGEVLRNIGVEPACPVPPGSYQLRQLIIDYSTWPDMLFGDFRLDTSLEKDGERIFCVRSYTLIQPRNNLYI